MYTKPRPKRIKQGPNRLNKRRYKEENGGPKNKVGPKNKAEPEHKVGPRNKVDPTTSLHIQYTYIHMYI